MVEKVDIGIVIALKEEFKELVASINATPHFEPSTSTYYYTFQHTIANTPYNCVTTFINTNDMGLTKAALATERLLQKFSPNIIVNIGIAGSLDSDLSLGDVVVARQTDNYLHNVKAVDNSTNNGFDFILSGDPYKTTEKYINHANSLDLAYQEKFNQWASSCNEKLNQLSASQQSTISKLEKLKQKGLLKKDPSIHTGNIASSTVLNVSIEFTDWLKKHHDRKCLAIEMESVGVADSAYTHGKEILIIRGISDFSDDRKKLLDNVGRGIFRKYAMYNIISLMWLLLEVDSSIHNKTKTLTKTYYLLFDGIISDFDKPKVEAILETLKRYTTDSTLQLRDLSSGSVIFILQGSEDGYNKLSQLLSENPNLEIYGHRILQVSLTPISKQPFVDTKEKFNQEVKTQHNASGVINADKTDTSNHPLRFMLETRKQQILDEIAAAYKQLGTSLSEVDKTRINRLIASLESELADIQIKIDSSNPPNQPNNPIPTAKHNLPHPNSFFTGRVDVLNQLSDLIKSNQQVAIKQAISGMGGVGKTQTALEFCHQHINDYQTILWIMAENQISFNNSYQEVAYLLELLELGNPKSLGNKDIIFLVKGWLSNNSNWLMVLDNLEDPKLIKDYLPSNHQGHILITTRSQSLKGQAAIVPLKKMSSETGILFLLKRANLIPIDANNLEQLKADNKLIDLLITDAQKIVQAMDGLPLALEQAGAYIQESECALADYLKAYQDVRNTIKILDNDGEDPNDHKSVYATFKLNFGVVKEKSIAAAKLLEVCSFLDSELIPEEIFTSAGKFLGDELAKLQDNNYEFNNCLKLLLNYSLIERDTNKKTLSIHRLVQAVIRKLIGQRRKKIIVKFLSKALHSLYPKKTDYAKDPNNWPHFQKLLPSVICFFDCTKFYQSNTTETAYLFHHFGVYCQTQALFAQSLTFYNQSLSIKKHLFGDNHPDVAQTLNNIGLIHQAQAQYSDALELHNQAQAIYNHLNGDNSSALASIFNNIGEVYRKQGCYPKALDSYNKALEIRKYPNKTNDYEIANILNNIGLVHKAQHNYSLALDLFTEARDITNNSLDLAATILNNIGEVYNQRSNYSLALEHFNQALDIKKSLFGNYHPSVAIPLNNIANSNYLSGSYCDALGYYEQALNLARNFDNELVAKILNNMGETYYKQDNYSKALDFYNESLHIKECYFHNNHASIANTKKNLGDLHKAINQQHKAIDYYKQALDSYDLAIRDQSFPPNHSPILQLLNQYSQLLIDLNKPDEAQPLRDRLASLESSS